MSARNSRGANHPKQSDGNTGGSIAQCMRKLAVDVCVEERMQLRLSAAEVAAIREYVRKAERLYDRCMDGGAALERILQEARQMQLCAEQARRDAVTKLPAWNGKTRVEYIAEKLCSSEVRLDRDALLLAIASFDDVQPLEMAEIWAMPQAMRVCLSRFWLREMRENLKAAGERQLVERWIGGARVNLARRGAEFFEYALKLLSEREDAGKKNLLERQLKTAGLEDWQLIQVAREAQYAQCRRLENIAANRRMLDRINWQDCFELLSTAEQELLRDPAGIYPQMEPDSKAAVRHQLSWIARRLRLNELTVARHAVHAAQLAGADASDVQRTVCYWLYDDYGRHSLVERMGASDAVLPRMTPDPTGKKSVVLIAALFVLLFGLYLMAVHSIWFVMMGIPLAWCSAMLMLSRVFPMFVKPARLLKLEIERVPDELRTLVVMPVLLSCKDRAREICDQFEALGCLEKDKNISYLLLGDFADANDEYMPGDDEIVSAVRERIAQMNLRAGREQFLYLHRGRRLLEPDGRWMGRDRKRGALMDLNRLLLGKCNAEDEFQAEGSACPKLKNQFRYVLTVDADTQFLPGAVQRLIGTLAHPLNKVRDEIGVRKGYSLLQPRMEMTASACVNGFVKLFAGSGGLESYPSSASVLWQDITGAGLFGGKGLYEVQAFSDALDGALPEGKILSHDLIEGTLAGAAQVSDICFYDGFPSSLSSFLKRQNRWMRGDWQLLPLLLSGKKYPVRNRSLSAAERVRLLDNLLRSLWAPSLLGLLIQSVWLGHADAFATGILLAYLTPVLYLFHCEGFMWRRATVELAMLPAMAACSVDAIVRTLWRLLVSKQHLLDWVTSADAEKGTEESALANRISAILLIPGIFVRGWAPAALALGLLFLTGPGWIDDLEHEVRKNSVSPQDDDLLRGLAEDTWKFFAQYVTVRTCYLPPDNVQMDPNTGMAKRTSPTNIGLYLMCCVAAHNLGLIAERELISRMRETLDTLERMERWKGHFYNWYDTEEAAPMKPRYVSAVDSGNFAAALLLCASAVEDASLAVRMQTLAREMDFTALYNDERHLFRIGMDVQRNRMSEAHYDLLASESRILSYTAMMLGQIPIRHWAHLGRACGNGGGAEILLSWSGTMFEYLMPELILPAPENTLLGQAVRGAIMAQTKLGLRKGRPWGVSESGYYAFDMHCSYQYRAFGLSALSLGGETGEDVVAPYASVMAACTDARSAAENIRKMESLGWRGSLGMYEAADYLHARADGSPRIVKSYMAHHQGMALCGLCNCLTDGSLHRAFQRIPEARALSLLLEERSLQAGKKRRPNDRAVYTSGKLTEENRYDTMAAKVMGGG